MDKLSEIMALWYRVKSFEPEIDHKVSLFRQNLSQQKSEEARAIRYSVVSYHNEGHGLTVLSSPLLDSIYGNVPERVNCHIRWEICTNILLDELTFSVIERIFLPPDHPAVGELFVPVKLLAENLNKKQALDLLTDQYTRTVRELQAAKEDSL